MPHGVFCEMPLIEFSCPKHGPYDSLIGMTAEPDDTTCPECHKHGIQSISAVLTQMGKTCEETSDLHPGHVKSVMKHKKWLNDNKAKIDSGEIAVKFQGPSWSLPDWAK